MDTCSYCGGEDERLVDGKAYCVSCQEAMYRECIRCHFPYHHPKYFLSDDIRCNSCQTKYLKEIQKPLSKVEEVTSDHESEDTISLPEQYDTKLSSEDEKEPRKAVKGRIYKKVVFSDNDYDEVEPPKKKIKKNENIKEKKGKKLKVKKTSEKGKGKTQKVKAEKGRFNQKEGKIDLEIMKGQEVCGFLTLLVTKSNKRNKNTAVSDTV